MNELLPELNSPATTNINISSSYCTLENTAQKEIERCRNRLTCLTISRSNAMSASDASLASSLSATAFYWKKRDKLSVRVATDARARKHSASACPKTCTTARIRRIKPLQSHTLRQELYRKDKQKAVAVVACAAAGLRDSVLRQRTSVVHTCTAHK